MTQDNIEIPMHELRYFSAGNIYYFAIVTGTIFVETSVTAVW